MNEKYKIIFIFTFSFLILLSSCVNLEQTTTINENGSGTIKLHYWTKASNLSMGDDLGGLNFNEEKAKNSYTSATTEVQDIKLETFEVDSTVHVRLHIVFKDINKLSEASGFSKIKASWLQGKDGMDFNYIIEKDSSTANNLGASQYKLEYKFIFPGEIVSTNGNIEGNSITWNKTIADLKNNIEMTATLKTKSKICGMFGVELPLILFFGLIFIKYKKIYKINLK